jgi:glycosyltransferase involved in cell wall biosynthesis
MKPLKIAINAQISPGAAGGVASILIGLISALGKLEDGQDEFIVIGPHHELDWLQSHIGPNQTIIRGPHRFLPSELWKSLTERSLNHLMRKPYKSFSNILQKMIQKATIPRAHKWSGLPISEGFYESLDCNVIHFPYQDYVICGIPSIFNPHDLQHIHFPQFFSPDQIARRETIYSGGCKLANTVVVGSHWIKNDVIRHYRIDSNKIQVVPWAAPTNAFPDPDKNKLQSIKNKYNFSEPFILYPAATWKHKNHSLVIKSIAEIRDEEDIHLNLVCTGYKTEENWPQLQREILDLQLSDQIKFLGFIPFDELRSIYHLAQFVIVPTLFEAASGPAFEAWHEGTPVACSNVTSLPEQVGDAAFVFDPYSRQSIKNALRTMSSDQILRKTLIKNGSERLKDFSWTRTAKAYRAVYRRAAKLQLSEEDQQLLRWDWMQNPKDDMGNP